MWAEKMAAVFLAELLGDAVAIALDLGGGGGDGPVEPFELVFDGVARQEPPRDAESLVVHDKHFADRHAGRNGNPLQTFHVVSNRRPMCSERAWPLGGDVTRFLGRGFLAAHPSALGSAAIAATTTVRSPRP